MIQGNLAGTTGSSGQDRSFPALIPLINRNLQSISKVTKFIFIYDFPNGDNCCILVRMGMLYVFFSFGFVT
jgi:hypothetical protein